LESFTKFTEKALDGRRRRSHMGFTGGAHGSIRTSDRPAETFLQEVFEKAIDDRKTRSYMALH
jgi:hypothetical protein